MFTAPKALHPEDPNSNEPKEPSEQLSLRNPVKTVTKPKQSPEPKPKTRNAIGTRKGSLEKERSGPPFSPLHPLLH